MSSDPTAHTLRTQQLKGSGLLLNRKTGIFLPRDCKAKMTEASKYIPSALEMEVICLRGCLQGKIRRLGNNGRKRIWPSWTTNCGVILSDTGTMHSRDQPPSIYTLWPFSSRDARCRRLTVQLILPWESVGWMLWHSPDSERQKRQIPHIHAYVEPIFDIYGYRSETRRGGPREGREGKRLWGSG